MLTEHLGDTRLYFSSETCTVSYPPDSHWNPSPRLTLEAIPLTSLLVLSCLFKWQALTMGY